MRELGLFHLRPNGVGVVVVVHCPICRLFCMLPVTGADSTRRARQEVRRIVGYGMWDIASIAGQQTYTDGFFVCSPRPGCHVHAQHVDGLQ